jgi:hypothetical protein
MAITRRRRELYDFISRFVAARLKPRPFKAEAAMAAVNRCATQEQMRVFSRKWLFPELIAGLCSGAPLVRMRVADARPGYWMMTTFMLQGVRVKVRGRVCAPMLVIFGGAQVLVPTGSGGVPAGEPDRS